MAKYLIDVNLPRFFATWASDEFVFVHDIDPTWRDGRVWEHAISEGLTIVTKDADFSDRVLISEAAPHVIHLRIGNMRMRDFHLLISAEWPEICRLSAEYRLVQVYVDRIECIA